jgi:hypothetical protein
MNHDHAWQLEGPAASWEEAAAGWEEPSAGWKVAAAAAWFGASDEGFRGTQRSRGKKKRRTNKILVGLKFDFFKSFIANC